MCHAAQLAKDFEALEQYEKLCVDALKAAVKNNAEMQSNVKENTDTESSGGKYSIEEDSDGNKYVEVYEDIFANSDGETIAKTIAMVIKDKFNNLIEVHGQKFKINKTTNDEWRRSEDATSLMEKSPSVYFDKLRTIANADELLKAANNWIGEAIKHERKDKIVEFARGNINFKVGDNGYSSDILVGIGSDGSAVLYDLIDIKEKNITEAQVTKAVKNRLRRQDTSVIDNNIPQNSDDVNPYSKKSLSETDSNAENVEDIYGFKIKQGVEVNEDLLELLSIYDKNAKVDTNGNVTVYHRTNADAAEKIRKTGIMTAKEDALFFSSEDNGYAIDYGDTVITLKIPSTVLEVNDVFDGEVHFDLPLRYKNGVYSLNVSQYIKDTDTKFSLSARTSAEYDLLTQANEELKAQVEALKNEMKLTKGHKVNPDAVNKLAKSTLRITT